MTKNKLDYKLAGVDISAGNKAVELIKDSVKSTFSKNVSLGWAVLVRSMISNPY
jgi:phosphoribosylaminoimidazole (AIR) synthetase